MNGGELPPPVDDQELEPNHTHRHSYRQDINDWWCFDCQNCTDFCVELNDFGQSVPAEEV